jgi:hypothetical protein
MAKFNIPLSEPDPPAPPKPRPVPFKATGKPLFDQLFPCSWRGISFPVSSIRVSLTQDLAEHRYWGKDAANVEATGRAPLEIEATIPFVNGIAPGKNERWGVLYPNTFLEFLEAFNDRTTGILDTPEIAGLTCKPQSVEFAHDAQRRDGVEVTARWIETVDLDLDSDVRIAPSEVANIAALNLDAQKPDLQKIAEPPEFGKTFEQMVNELGGVLDTTASRITQLANKPNQIIFRLKRLHDSAERVRTALTWPVTDGYHRLKMAVHDLEKLPNKIKNATRKIGRYQTTQRMSLAGLQQILSNNTVDDLISLNPRLASRPQVASNTVVRFFE